MAEGILPGSGISGAILRYEGGQGVIIRTNAIPAHPS